MAKVEFLKNSEGVKLMAIYLSQLEKENVAYQIDNRETKYEISITGH